MLGGPSYTMGDKRDPHIPLGAPGPGYYSPDDGLTRNHEPNYTIGGGNSERRTTD